MGQKNILSFPGFTLVELLLVIALLGAFMIGLIGALDPFEQLKKGTDTSRMNTVNEFYNAIVRSYAVSGRVPIQKDVFSIPLSSVDAMEIITSLQSIGELKSNFTQLSSKDLNSIFVSASQDGRTLAVCFRPESKSFMSSKDAVFDKFGARSNYPAASLYICTGESDEAQVATYVAQTGMTVPQPSAPPSSSYPSVTPIVTLRPTNTSIPLPTVTPPLVPTQIPTSTLIPTPTAVPTNTPTPTSAPGETPVIKRVLVIDYNPVLRTHANMRLRQYKGWSDPLVLEQQYIQDVKEASGGYVTYQVVERIDVSDKYFPKSDGYTYTETEYLNVLAGTAAHHNPDWINYNLFITTHDICGKVNRNEIDEVWLWGGPWMGYAEAIMAGPGAYFTNGSPITGTTCTKKVVIMGFNYERGVSEMIEDIGHRFEGTLRTAFGGWFAGQSTDWDKFTKGRNFHGSEGTFNYGCGTVHDPHNSASGYDWANTSVVPTTCRSWTNYPPTSTTTASYSCTEWGCSGYGYKKYWLAHIPKSAGSTNGKFNNWWRYLFEL
jgi:hypothetical protein